jgi:phosphomethylpyrimidine synthase
MDLSPASAIDQTREAILAVATVPIGTVPIHQAIEGVKKASRLASTPPP